MERWTMQIQGKSYEVQVTFKRMKTVRLRVVSGGQIRLSAPHGTNQAWLRQFLQERESWIATNVERMQQRSGPGDSESHTDEVTTRSMTAAERKKALAYLMPMVEQWYPAVAPYGIPMPHVTVRRMSSRYGSCSVSRGRITLAAMLLDVPKACAEYVVLHELTHFLHPNHGRGFYAFLEQQMPDWKEREQFLRQQKM